MRHAERALRRQEENIRRAYVDVLDAVTGGKLILLTDEELAGQLGVPLTEPARGHGAARARARRAASIARTAAERFPDWAPRTDVRTPVVRGARQRAAARRRRHATSCSRATTTLQVLVRDDGPGIDFRTLPRATLQRGFSTAVEPRAWASRSCCRCCERVLLSTRPGARPWCSSSPAGRALRREPRGREGRGVVARLGRLRRRACGCCARCARPRRGRAPRAPAARSWRTGRAAPS